MNNAETLVKDDELDRYEQSVQAFLGQHMDGDRFILRTESATRTTGGGPGSVSAVGATPDREAIETAAGQGPERPVPRWS